MRLKIMLHYAVSFFFTCLFIVIINIFYMRSSVYEDNELYRFNPQPELAKLASGLSLGTAVPLDIAPELREYLDSQGMGLQVIDSALGEVLRAGGIPDNTPKRYTPARLVALYGSDAVTTFASDLKIDEQDYTILMFLDPARIKRTLYTYDVAQVGAAYNLYWLVGMNIVLLLVISYLYTYTISRPVHRITERILMLAHGRYEAKEVGKGIYVTVEHAMNQLAKQLEASRQERALADSMREEWIANLSHDIKTPLTSMMGYGELLGDTDYTVQPEERSQYKNLILEKGRYIKTLLADLNLAIRLKHHQYPLNMEPANLIAVIKTGLINALNSCTTESSRHSVAFTHTHDKVNVLLDRHLFERVLINLVHNAFIHNEAAVSLTVHVDASDAACISITIDDDGVGVEPEELPRIFARYYRGTHTSTKSEGSGLGLAIAKDIIEAHTGTITPEKSPRGGLKITIQLKRSNHEALS